MAKAEDNLFNLWMHPKEHFMTFIIHFKKEGLQLLAQLNASNVIEAPEPTPEEPINPDALINDPEHSEDKEALWANCLQSSNKPWIDVPLKVQE
ncbi:hypothetical protein C0992_004930 [Termitomyces sp. T32_za158]|nr:hypothetical protein C0992_004930 [Termitomyces sp. T32_za158]